MRRILAAAVMGLMMTTSSVFAADEESATTLAPAVAAAATSLAQRADLTAAMKRVQFNAPKRPMVLPALYASSALLQGYDAYSTLTALKGGAVEANPMMKTITKSPVAFIGLKAGVTTLSIMSAERMWKRGNRIGAIATMAVSNGFMAWVAQHNAGVIRKMDGGR